MNAKSLLPATRSRSPALRRKTLPENIDDVGTWLSGVTQNVTWWKDAEKPMLVLVK